MLRGENIVCGTSSTGTGTLNLAATPVAPGGISPYVLGKATGVGFADGADVLIPYTIIEYTDSTFATQKQMEKGVGTLHLGTAIGGGTPSTLARTTKQVTATSLDSQPATYNTNAPSAITIGTAANVLIFIGPSAADIFACSPYFEKTLGDALGVFPLTGNAGAAGTGNLTSGTDYYMPFYWECPILAKTFSFRVSTAYSGGTPVSNAHARIYAPESGNFRPGKLLIDFGLLGTVNASLNTQGQVSSAAHANGYFLTPGWYWANIFVSFSGGSTPPVFNGPANTIGSMNNRNGSTGFARYVSHSATGGSSTASDPANTTSWAGATAVNGGSFHFALRDS